MKEITTKQELTTDSGTSILVFHATWCGPCKVYKPTYERLERNKGVQVFRADVDRARKLADTYRVRSVPTTVIFKNGQQVRTQSGNIPYNMLDQLTS